MNVIKKIKLIGGVCSAITNYAFDTITVKSIFIYCIYTVRNGHGF